MRENSRWSITKTNDEDAHSLFVNRTQLVSAAINRLTLSNANRPIAVWGQAGSGKTHFIAEALYAARNQRGYGREYSVSFINGESYSGITFVDFLAEVRRNAEPQAYRLGPPPSRLALFIDRFDLILQSMPEDSAQALKAHILSSDIILTATSESDPNSLPYSFSGVFEPYAFAPFSFEEGIACLLARAGDGCAALWPVLSETPQAIGALFSFQIFSGSLPFAWVELAHQISESAQSDLLAIVEACIARMSQDLRKNYESLPRRAHAISLGLIGRFGMALPMDDCESVGSDWFQTVHRGIASRLDDGFEVLCFASPLHYAAAMASNGKWQELVEDIRFIASFGALRECGGFVFGPPRFSLHGAEPSDGSQSPLEFTEEIPEAISTESLPTFRCGLLAPVGMPKKSAAALRVCEGMYSAFASFAEGSAAECLALSYGCGALLDAALREGSLAVLWLESCRAAIYHQGGFAWLHNSTTAWEASGDADDLKGALLLASLRLSLGQARMASLTLELALAGSEGAIEADALSAFAVGLCYADSDIPSDVLADLYARMAPRLSMDARSRFAQLLFRTWGSGLMQTGVLDALASEICARPQQAGSPSGFWEAIEDAASLSSDGWQAAILASSFWALDHISASEAFRTLAWLSPQSQRQSMRAASEALYGSLMAAAGKPKEALGCYVAALGDIKRVYGPSHPYMAIVECNLGVCYQELKEDAFALMWHQRAFETRLQAQGGDYSLASFSSLQAAKCMMALDRHTEALDWLIAAFAFMEEKEGRAFQWRDEIASQIAYLFSMFGDYKSSQEWFDKIAPQNEGV